MDTITGDNDDLEVIWYTVTNTTAKYVPAWMRSCAVDATGELWVPAVLAGDEAVVLLLSGFDDAEPVYEHEGHFYVRSTWMGREYPNLISLLDKMRRNAAERIERDNAHLVPRAARALSREK